MDMNDKFRTIWITLPLGLGGAFRGCCLRCSFGRRSVRCVGDSSSPTSRWGSISRPLVAAARRHWSMMRLVRWTDLVENERLEKRLYYRLPCYSSGLTLGSAVSRVFSFALFQDQSVAALFGEKIDGTNTTDHRDFSRVPWSRRRSSLT